MRGHLVGFHFCPILLSGVALFLVTFSSSLHTDLSRVGVGGGEGGRGKGHSIFVVTISRVSQFSLVTPLNSVSDD